MPKIPIVSGKKLLKILLKNGFIEMRRKGSHIFVVSIGDERLCSVIPVHGNEDLGKGLLSSILSDLGISVEELIGMIR